MKVAVEDVGGPQVEQKILASCAAGGADLPDVVGVQNAQGETVWSRFPDCFTDLNTMHYGELSKAFPDFKRAELEVGTKAFAMPWDSGPVMMFYRRDFYKNAGVDPASIKSWDDFIAAGKKIMAANPGVVMAQANFAGETEWLRMMANEEHCGFFDAKDGSITVAQPGCVAALAKRSEPGPHHIETVIKILTKAFGFHFRGEIAIGCGDHPEIRTSLRQSAYRAIFLLL